MYKFNIPVRQGRDAQVNKIEIQKELLTYLYFNQNKSLLEIGTMFNCDDETIRRLMIIYDMDRKDKTINLGGWNKGLTKEENENIKLQSEKTSMTRKFKFKNGDLIHYNLGKTQPLKTRKKISNSLIGKNRGKDNSNWKGGKNSLYQLWRKRIEGSIDYKELRKNVFARDDYTCQMCYKLSNGDLQLHHIKEVCKNHELILVNNNCITLCKVCHTSIRNKEEQYEEKFYERIQSNSRK